MEPSPPAPRKLQPLLKDLLKENMDSEEFYRVLFHFLEDHYEDLARGFEEHLPEDRLMQLASVFLILTVRPAFRTFERRTRFFDMAQAMGVHILPNHFYNPVPDTSKLPPSTWTERFDRTPGWRLDAAQQRALLAELARWRGELSDIPREDDGDGRFYWDSGAIPAVDAAAYYAMIRRFRPKKIIEVGCGYSTLIAARACAQNGAGELHGIDPYPAPCLQPLPADVASLTQLPAQAVPLARFEELEAGDMLFIDSTHVSKIGSDVNYLLLQVVPRLRPGVIVHVHDIFLPWEMPKNWVLDQKLFWNEQYLLLAFLMFNSEFEVLLASQFLAREHRTEFERAFPFGPAEKAASFWMRRL